MTHWSKHFDIIKPISNIFKFYKPVYLLRIHAGLVYMELLKESWIYQMNAVQSHYDMINHTTIKYSTAIAGIILFLALL